MTRVKSKPKPQPVRRSHLVPAQKDPLCSIREVNLSPEGSLQIALVIDNDREVTWKVQPLDLLQLEWAIQRAKTAKSATTAKDDGEADNYGYDG